MDGHPYIYIIRMNLCVFLGPAIVVLLFAVSLPYLRLGMLIYRVRLISRLASFLGITIYLLVILLLRSDLHWGCGALPKASQLVSSVLLRL